MNKEFSQIVSLFLADAVEDIVDGVVSLKPGGSGVVCYAMPFEIDTDISILVGSSVVKSTVNLDVDKLSSADAALFRIPRRGFVQFSANGVSKVLGVLGYPAVISYVPGLNYDLIRVSATVPACLHR